MAGREDRRHQEPTRTVLIDAFPRSALRQRERDALVCIDVMLSTTTLVSGAAAGRRAFVAASPVDARRMAASLESPVVAGEASAGALVADSPVELTGRGEDERPLVLFSPPGTELIRNAEGQADVLVACFRNLTATAARVARHCRRVALLAAGCRQEVSCEDQMAAAWIAGILLQQGFAPEDRRTQDVVRRWEGVEPSLAALGNSAAQLRGQGRDADVEFVLSHIDDLPVACAVIAGEVHLFEASLPAPPPPTPGPADLSREHH